MNNGVSYVSRSWEKACSFFLPTMAVPFLLEREEMGGMDCLCSVLDHVTQTLGHMIPLFCSFFWYRFCIREEHFEWIRRNDELDRAKKRQGKTREAQGQAVEQEDSLRKYLSTPSFRSGKNGNW